LENKILSDFYRAVLLKTAPAVLYFEWLGSMVWVWRGERSVVRCGSSDYEEKQNSSIFHDLQHRSLLCTHI